MLLIRLEICSQLDEGRNISLTTLRPDELPGISLPAGFKVTCCMLRLFIDVFKVLLSF